MLEIGQLQEIIQRVKHFSSSLPSASSKKEAVSRYVYNGPQGTCNVALTSMQLLRAHDFIRRINVNATSWDTQVYTTSH